MYTYSAANSTLSCLLCFFLLEWLLSKNRSSSFPSLFGFWPV
jgi:hypothetical protein